MSDSRTDDSRPAATAGAAAGREERGSGRQRRATTPMMSQYVRLKEEVGDAILFFRMGDFYEMFFEDAVQAAEILDLTLTSRNKSDPDPIPMAGFPWHSAEPYVVRLLKAGKRVAICEQVESSAGGLMERRIVEIQTPGTALAEGLLDDSRNNYLGAIGPGPEAWGLAIADVSTGEFAVGETSAEGTLSELEQMAPRELLVPGALADDPLLAGFFDRHPEISRTALDDWHFSASRGRQLLREQFQVATLDPYGIESLDLALAAAGALLSYAKEQRRSPLAHLRPPRPMRASDALLLDDVTLRNLEVLEPLAGRGRHCLLGILDNTRTAMGSRALRRALRRPMVALDAIRKRHDGVAVLSEDPESLEALREELRRVADLERLIARLHCGRGTPRDLARARDSLQALPVLLEIVGRLDSEGRFPVGARLDPLAELREELIRALQETPALSLDGEVIRDGHDVELDRLRGVARDGRDWVSGMQQREREATGIPSLKVGYNKVFGYYLEVTRTHLSRVPSRYQRKQTLVGAERYITPELKEWEEKIVGARDAARERQAQLIEELRGKLLASTAGLQAVATTVAEWDLLCSFAAAARKWGYVRPEMDESDRIRVRDGRHPVVERFLDGESFVPNDIDLDTRERQILIITGPNMAGKSTFLRQMGLLVLMAQAGSFIPAREAQIGIADRLFTRVGASDDIARGQSTFLVEMLETSRILHESTSRSLVLLDEIGRGTSTFDGLAIAWAVAERLRENPMRRPRTLFATHFHELTALARHADGYLNLNVLVKEWKEKVIFVRRVVEGSADRSYGIQVARLAGLPESVLERAREILVELEKHGPLMIDGALGGGKREAQLPLFGKGERVVADSPSGTSSGELELLREALQELDPDRMNPREALAWLYELKERLAESKNSRPDPR
jgi:DNA mismatch repair protein MutS